MAVELLAPAGNMDKLRTAITYGADSVYIGGKQFSLREGADNFSIDEIRKAVTFAHSLGKRVYLTLNITFHNHHFPDFEKLLDELNDIPIDGYILSDPGAIELVAERYPEKKIHVSTQANTVNWRTVRFYEKLGAGRVILARELSLSAIKEIRDKTGVELETFVHGAMCIAYSGRCLLSNYMTNQSLYRDDENPGKRKNSKTRDANLGDCAQSCRWKYQLVEMNREGQAFPITEEPDGTTAILSSRDLNLAAHLDKLIDAGIDSFKIEGRMKSVYYVANVTRVYRHAIDAFQRGDKPDPAILSELNKVSHREFTTGFFFERNECSAETTADSYFREFRYMGRVIEAAGPKRYRCRSANQIKLGDDLEAILPGAGNRKLSGFKLYRDGEPVELVQPDFEFVMETDPDLEDGAIFRKRWT